MSDALTKITDHYGAAFKRLGSKFATVPEILSTLQAICAEVQEVEGALWDLLTKRFVDTGEGAQLDVIGRIVRQARGPSDDPTYRLQLKARIKILLSSGGPEEIIAAFAIAHTGTVILSEDYPAGFLLELGDGDSITNLQVFLQFLRDLRAEGVGTNLRVQGDTDANTFACAGPLSQLNGSHVFGLSVLNVSPNFPADFPAAGTAKIGSGEAIEETIAFLSRTSNTITLASALVHTHADKSTVVAVTPGKGWGDSANGATGGKLSGEWEA